MTAIPLSEKLEQMLISAERYACGRQSYIVGVTVDYLISRFPTLSDWCIGIMKRDVSEKFAMAERSGHPDLMGDDCDRRDWQRFLVEVRKEQERRKNGATKQPTKEIELRPVKHGYWTPVDDLLDAFDCSECDAMVQKEYNFCPKCGADMRNSTQKGVNNGKY